MADEINHPNVVGNDNVRPVWYPDGRWQTLALHQTWMGENGGRELNGVIVPLWVARVNDYVENVFTHETFQVTALDERFVPTLVPIVRNANTLTQKDILTTLGPGFGSADHKITIDTSVYPHRLDVSPFVRINAVEAKYAKIVRGSVFGEHQVIGFLMSPSGQLTNDKIPLDLIQEVAGVTNYQVKNIQTCYTNIKVLDGEPLGVALYSAAGNFLSESQLVAVNSGFMRDGTAPRDYIESVYIESPYLSPDNPFELHLPLNWNNTSLNMIGVVQYQSGRKVKLPIDERKFKLEGMNQLLSSIAGQTCDMVLKYALDRSENTVHSVNAFSNSIPQPYRCLVTKANNSYSVKLYAFPVWDTVSNNGYKLRFYLMNLDRDQFVEVTSAVKYVVGTPLFDGHLYGLTQRLQVSLNLRDVLTTYKPFVHTQAFEVSLYGTPDEFDAPWTVRQTNLDAKPYGTGLFAKRSVDGLTTDITCGYTKKEDWLERLFAESYPLLTDPRNESSHPTPSHFAVRAPNGSYTEFSVEEWNLKLALPGGTPVHTSLDVIWKYKNAGSEMLISTSSLIVQQAQN